MHKFLDQPVEMTIHNLVGSVPENAFISLVVKVSYARANATPASSKILDDRESALSFNLSLVHRFLLRRGIISSTKVAREAVLVVSMPRVAGVAGVTEVPISTTRTILALRLEKGSFFLALIRAYIP